MKNIPAPPEIADLPFFRQLPTEEVSRVLRYGRRVTFPQGWPLMAEGTPGDVAYILLEGQLTVWLGREAVTTLEAGSIVGETSLQQDRLRAATVSAATPVAVLRLGSRRFARLIANSPAFARAVDDVIAQRTAPRVASTPESVSEYRQGGRSLRAALIRMLCRVFVWPTLRWWPLRGPLVRMMPWLDLILRVVPRLRSTEHERVNGGTWRGELVEPRTGPKAEGALLYLHGGAFLFCGLATHRRIVERLALRTGLPVLSVGYRHLPGSRLTDSLADALDAFAWLGKRGISSESIVCLGDSAGGHLAFALALRANQIGLGSPAGIVGLSPWLDFDSRTKQAHGNARTDVFIPARRLSRVAQLCAGDDNGTIDPACSPVNGELAGLPPVLLHCAEDEVLRCDAELMAQRLAAAGVRCRMRIWQGQVHAFPVLGHFLPESRAALDDISTFVATVLPGDGRRHGPLHTVPTI